MLQLIVPGFIKYRVPKAGFWRGFLTGLDAKKLITYDKDSAMLINNRRLEDLYTELKHKKDFYSFLIQMDPSVEYPLSPTELYLYNAIIRRLYPDGGLSNNTDILRELRFCSNTRIDFQRMKDRIKGSTMVTDKLRTVIEANDPLPTLNGRFEVSKNNSVLDLIEEYVHKVRGIYCFNICGNEVQIFKTPCDNGNWETIRIKETDVLFYLLKPIFPKMSLPAATIGTISVTKGIAVAPESLCTSGEKFNLQDTATEEEVVKVPTMVPTKVDAPKKISAPKNYRKTVYLWTAIILIFIIACFNISSSGYFYGAVFVLIFFFVGMYMWS